MDDLPRSLGGAERARCQHLVFGVVRNAGRLEAALDRVVAHSPRFPTRAILFLAGFELIEDGADPGRAARIVHHAVEQAKKRTSAAESRLVNAVARRLSEAIPAQSPPPVGAPATALSEFYSHPRWLVERWLAQYGESATHALLEWNQRPAPVYARIRGQVSDIDVGGTADINIRDLTPSPWPGFFEIPAGRWSDIEPLIKDGRLYVQDPSARLPVELLAPRPGETVLDACASPGGKSLLIADAMSGSTARIEDMMPPDGDKAPPGRIVAIDLPGERIVRLRENLVHAGVIEATVVPADLLNNPAAELRKLHLPTAYPAVLLDAPCTNTGVMRHRIDVKWRLQERDFSNHARQQLGLLEAVSRLVAPGGRLVYSTCSIDADENEGAVAAFIKRSCGRFVLDGQILSKPWETGHDGGGAFLLRRGQVSDIAVAGTPAAAISET